MITYAQLRGWRNLCEYLEQRWYKFATPEEIKEECKGVLPPLYNPSDRRFRESLFNNHLIQFIQWGQHPILNYSHSSRTRRTYKNVKGWRLTAEWEYKIDYLEQMLFFDNEIPKKWESDLRIKMSERARREEKLRLKKHLWSLPISKAKEEAKLLNLCWRCYEPITFLMLDCVNCGAIQDGD